MTTSMAKKGYLDFTEGPITPQIINFAIPMFLANILQQMYSLTDSIIVGHIIGPEALAAIGATTPITNLFIAFASGITLGVTVIISQNRGAKDIEAIRKVISTGYIFFAILSLAVSIPGIIFSRMILEHLNAPSEILDDAAIYLRVIFSGTIFMICYNVSNAIYRGVGNSRGPLYFLGVSIFLNILLDIVLLVVFDLGVLGTAIATIFSQAAAFIVSMANFGLRYPEFRIRRHERAFDTFLLRKFLGIGVPSGIKGALYWGGFVVISSIINTFGTSVMAAYTMASKIDTLLQSPIVSLQNSLTSFVGQNAGAKHTERIRGGLKTGFKAGIAYALFMTLFIFLAAPALLRLFTTDEYIIEIGTEYLRITSIFYMIFAIQEVPQSVAVGCGDSWVMMISTISAMWVVRIPLALLFSSMFGRIGIWISLPSGWFVAMCFANGYYLSNRWQRKILANKI